MSPILNNVLYKDRNKYENNVFSIQILLQDCWYFYIFHTQKGMERIILQTIIIYFGIVQLFCPIGMTFMIVWNTYFKLLYNLVSAQCILVP